MHFRKQGFHSLAVVALFLVALVAAGCGGSSDSSTSSTSGADAQDAARVKFAQCLRENGVDIPDNAGQNPGSAGRALQDVDQTKLQAAMKACQKYQQAAVGNISDEQQQELRDAFTKFASCMRQNGVDLPDMNPGGGPPSGGQQINRDDPTTKAAMSACQDKLPRGGPGGQGGQ